MIIVTPCKGTVKRCCCGCLRKGFYRKYRVFNLYQVVGLKGLYCANCVREMSEEKRDV